MATVVNIKPSNMFAGFNEAFSKSMQQKRQGEMAAEADQRALDGKIAIMQADITMKKQVEEDKTAMMQELIGNTSQDKVEAAGIDEGIGKLAGYKPEITEEQAKATQLDAKQKLGAKGLMIDPAHPNMAITSEHNRKNTATDIAASQATSNKAHKAMQTQNEWWKMQSNRLKFNTSAEKEENKNLMIRNGSSVILKSKLFQSFMGNLPPGTDDKEGANQLATYLANNDQGFLDLLVTAQGREVWVTKSSLDSGVGAESIVAPGTSGAMPFDAFSKLYGEKNNLKSDTMKTAEGELKDFSISKSWAGSHEEFDKVYPVGSIQRTRVQGWKNRMTEVKKDSTDVFAQGKADIQGWRELDKLQEKAFKLQYESVMSKIMATTANGTFDTAAEIPDADVISINLKQVLFQDMRDIFGEKNQTKAGRKAAVTAAVSLANVDTIMLKVAERMSASTEEGDSAPMAGEFLARTIKAAEPLSYKREEKNINSPMPESWQDKLAVVAKNPEIRAILLDPNHPKRNVIFTNLKKLHKADYDAIKAVEADKRFLLAIVGQQ